METIILEFERVTKYPLVKFLATYRDFMLNSYSEIDRYFSGTVVGIDNKHLTNLEKITTECKNVLSVFKNFANKFDKCGYWELMDYLEELNTAVEKINKLPKFKRTSLTKRGYQPYIQQEATVGGFRTMEDVANSIRETNSDNTQWVELMLANDMYEADWEIDKTTPLNVLIDNKIYINVTTILEQPIGKRVYGRDIKKKIEFVDNDLAIVEFQDNIEQKCGILLSLKRGDVPEFPLFGINPFLTTGNTVGSFSYPELARNIENNFLQNDLFAEVRILGYKIKDSDIWLTIEIQTKYDYKTEKEKKI